MRKLRSLLPFFLIAPLGLAALLSSCCEPAAKDSRPVVIDSLFDQTSGYDLDLFTTQQRLSSTPDSGYYPIYTFGILNSGSEADDFTLNIGYYGAGFSITRRVPPHQVVLFRTPTPKPDSITSQERIHLAVFPGDSSPVLVPRAYYGMFQAGPDSTRIRFMRPTVSITYGAVDNGPEACNTPAVTYNFNIDELKQ